MTKLDEIIKNIHDDDINIVKLKDIIIKGPKSKYGVKNVSNLDSGNIICFTSGSKKYYVNEHLVDGEYIFMNDGGVADIKFNKGKALYTDHVFAFTIKDFVPKYIYYYLLNMKSYINDKFFKGAGLKNLNKKDFLDFEIKIPKIDIQNEIVRVLDLFTDIISELTLELFARKKQYEFYREDLLNFKSELNVEWKTLGEISVITRGGNFQKKDFVENGKPCIHYGQIYTKYGITTDHTFTFIDNEVFIKSKIAKPNDIIMAVTSENVEDICKCVAWLGNDDIAVSGHTAIIHHNQNPKYLAYYFQSRLFYNQKLKYTHGTKVIEITPSKLNEILVPLPNLDEQCMIAEKLDCFYNLCFNSKKGIPAEIEARKKQYEYYRNKLLKF